MFVEYSINMLKYRNIVELIRYIQEGENAMRVISGTARGMKLQSPKGLNTRPTTDRVKESMFNIISFRIRESRVLDIFAGSGALGIEALSRGADSCTFVDSSRESIVIINENLKKARLDDRAYVISTKVESALSRLADEGFDMIFMDPPYCKGFIEPVLSSIVEKGILGADGIVVVEHDSSDKTPQNIKGLVRSDERIYGGTTISFYELED